MNESENISSEAANPLLKEGMTLNDLSLGTDSVELPPKVARIEGDGTSRVTGDVASTREEIKRLQRVEKLLEEQARKDAEEDRRQKEGFAKAYTKKFNDLKSEIEEKVRRCPGTTTQVACPICIKDATPIISTSWYSYPGRQDLELSITLGAPLFFMKKQKDGTLLCPRCGASMLAF